MVLRSIFLAVDFMYFGICVVRNFHVFSSVMLSELLIMNNMEWSDTQRFWL